MEFLGLVFWGNSKLFHNDCTSLQSCQQCRRLPFPVHLLFFKSLMIVIVTWEKWGILFGNLSIVLIFTFQWPNLLNILSCTYWTFVLVNFFKWFFYSASSNFLRSLCILDITLLSKKQLAKVFPICRLSFHSAGLSLAVQKLFNLVW